MNEEKSNLENKKNEDIQEEQNTEHTKNSENQEDQKETKQEVEEKQESKESEEDVEGSEEDLKSRLKETEEKMEEVITENEKLNDKFSRLAAEFKNYKKRTRKEEQERLKYEGKNILKELLPVFDDIDRAVEHQENSAKKDSEEGSSQDSDNGGLQMIHKKLHNVLNNLGVEKYDSVGEEFDPDLHHAIMTKESEEHDSDIVLEEIEKGYMYKDKVLRYARVIVSK